MDDRGDEKKRTHQYHSFEPVRLAVLHDVVDGEHYIPRHRLQIAA